MTWYIVAVLFGVIGAVVGWRHISSRRAAKEDIEHGYAIEATHDLTLALEDVEDEVASIPDDDIMAELRRDIDEHGM